MFVRQGHKSEPRQQARLQIPPDPARLIDGCEILHQLVTSQNYETL